MQRHLVVGQAVQDTRDNARAGTGPACERLPGSPLPYAHVHLVASENLDEFGVDALGECRMELEGPAGPERAEEPGVVRHGFEILGGHRARRQQVVGAVFPAQRHLGGQVLGQEGQEALRPLVAGALDEGQFLLRGPDGIRIEEIDHREVVFDVALEVLAEADDLLIGRVVYDDADPVHRLVRAVRRFPGRLLRRAAGGEAETEGQHQRQCGQLLHASSPFPNRWQATSWSGPTGLSTGRSLRQMSPQCGQRSAKGQPAGTSRGLGGSPLMGSIFLEKSIFVSNTAFNSARE